MAKALRDHGSIVEIIRNGKVWRTSEKLGVKKETDELSPEETVHYLG